MWNQFKTVILLGALTGLLLLVGQLLGGNSGLIIGLVIAIAINFGSYFYSDKIVLKMYKAKEASKSNYPELYNVVKEISEEAKIPMPKVYIVPTNLSNAFACGRDYKHSTVAVTNGILQLLNKDELKGVIAHEISHIKNRDILISTIAATIAGVISYLAIFARFGAMFGGFGGRDSEGGNNIIGILIVAIVTPIIAMLIQMAISRSREYLADESGAKLIKNGESLASALEKLEANVKQNPMRAMPQTEATAHMFVLNPFGKLKGLASLFMTHPQTKIRAEKLRALKF